ncbi:MAG: YihY/virulence factor BrkB family protein [Bacteroidota bacterium]|nr:YihY/virulence factor BrkB family protein [Bacteroidota bacterium]
MRKFWLIVRQAFTEFMNDRALKFSASLSYYTLFSLGPVLLIIISLAGIFLGKDAVEGKIYGQIQGLVGSAVALQIQDIIGGIEESRVGRRGAIVGVIFLFVGATGVFTEMQDSINYIWSIRTKARRGFIKLIFDRLLSFSLIIGFSFVLMVSLGVHALVDLLYDRLASFFSEVTVIVFQAVNYVILFVVIATLFAIIFKVLPDARIRWKDAFAGATFTSVLFMIGKSLIGLYLSNSNVGVTYGAAASVVIILIWVYYTSIILYFGAEFTKVYTMNLGGGIVPKKTAVFIIKQEVTELTPSLEDIAELEDKQKHAE